MALDKTTVVLEHNKQREIEALARKSTGSEGKPEGEWLLKVPFAGRGMSNVRLSAGEIYNFAVSVAALDPAPGDLVLDLGAGSCWVSDWLNRLLVDSVSLDISHDMLMIGRRRLAAGAKQTAGNFERLPFASESLDGAICLSALHHVPDIPAALREVCRVLKRDGTVVFSEPGMGHSSHPQSQSEMTECGVMERDIIVNELLDECLKAGFRDVALVPYLFPPPVYDHGTWEALDRAGRSEASALGAAADTRSRIRARARSLWLRLAAAAPVVHRLASKVEFVSRRLPVAQPGEPTADAPDPALAWQSLRLLHHAVRIHPVVIVRKEPRRPDSRRPHILNAELSLVSAPAEVASGASFTVTVRARNTGDTTWLHTPTLIGGHVALGAKLVDESGLAVVYDYGRGHLSRTVLPGESLPVEITLTAPAAAGRYQIKLDMVDECIAWFEHHGAQPLLVPLGVLPG